jgi:hypothetical protein
MAAGFDPTYQLYDPAKFNPSLIEESEINEHGTIEHTRNNGSIERLSSQFVPKYFTPMDKSYILPDGQLRNNQAFAIAYLRLFKLIQTPTSHSLAAYDENFLEAEKQINYMIGTLKISLDTEALPTPFQYAIALKKPKIAQTLYIMWTNKKEYDPELTANPYIKTIHGLDNAFEVVKKELAYNGYTYYKGATNYEKKDLIALEDLTYSGNAKKFQTQSNMAILMIGQPYNALKPTIKGGKRKRRHTKRRINKKSRKARKSAKYN